MRTRMTRVAAACAALLAAAAMAAPALAQTPVPFPSTYEHVVRSAVNGREYHVGVSLPPAYRSGDTTRFPVLYMLDGGAHLPLLASLLRLSNRSGTSGNVILVGVGYAPPGVFPTAPPAPVPFRTVDYAQPAGMAAFHQALKTEIIPLVERTYRTNGERALHGHSYGGRFATWALFEDPDLFSRYAIMSPAYQAGDTMFVREAAFRRTRTSLRKQVFLAVGGLEGAAMIADMWRMTAALCAGRASGNYAGLELAAEVIPDEHHNSGALFGRSMKALYPPVPPTPSDVCVSR